MRCGVAAVLLAALLLPLCACTRKPAQNAANGSVSTAGSAAGQPADSRAAGPYASLVEEFCQPKGPPKFVKKLRLKSYKRERSDLEIKADPDYECWNPVGKEQEDLRPDVSHSPAGKRWSLAVTVGWIAERQHCTPEEVRADFMREHAAHKGEFLDRSDSENYPFHSGFYSYQTRWLDCHLAELKQGSEAEKLAGAQISINCRY